jgi:hypothetical protein
VDHNRFATEFVDEELSRNPEPDPAKALLYLMAYASASVEVQKGIRRRLTLLVVLLAVCLLTLLATQGVLHDLANAALGALNDRSP